MSILRKNILIPAATVAVLFATTLCSRADDLPSSPGGAFDHDNQAPWSTPGDGRLVMLARNAAGFNQPMPFRFRVCVTNFTGANNSVNLYVWTTPGFEPTPVSSAQPQARQLQLGECAEIDTPAAIIVQDATTSGTSSGYYQLLRPTPAPPDVQPPPTTTASVTLHKHDDPSIVIGRQFPHNVICNKLPNPTADYYAACNLPLVPIDKSVNGHRICIGNNFVTWHTPPEQINYPAGLLELVIDSHHLPPTNMPQPYDYNWNPVSQLGCRDVIGAAFADFLVGPNTIGGYWDPSQVKSINVTTQTITLVRGQ